MPSFATLFNDPKYADTTIVCDGKNYFVHRAIICSRSEVLAVEFDDKLREDTNKTIHHDLFDASTLGCMLQFIYEGDYTVRADSIQSLYFYSHGLCDEDCDQPCTIGKEPQITNMMTAHALVYGTGDHYNLPDLAALSLKKFKDSTERLEMEDFLRLAYVVYRNTKCVDDPLRLELIKILIDNYLEWLCNEEFKNDLHERLMGDDVLNQFMHAVTDNVSKELVQQAAQNRLAAEAQATASKMLLSDLGQTRDALVQSTERILALETGLEATKDENIKLEAKVANYVREVNTLCTAINELQLSLYKSKEQCTQAEEELEHAKDRTKALVVDKINLTAQLKKVHDTLASNKGQTNTASLDVKALTAKLKTANEHLKNETKRVDESKKICNAKDKTIAAEKARADKGKSIIKSIVKMVNEHDGCRRCGEYLHFTLETDDRLNMQGRPKAQPFNRMLLCQICRTKTYGTNIALY